MRPASWILPLVLIFTATSAPAAPAPADASLEAAASAIAAQRAGLRSVLESMDAQTEIFPREPVEDPRLLGPEARALALSYWAAFADLLLGLEQSVRHLPRSEQEGGSSWSDAFALRRAAFLARYRHAMEFTLRVERDPRLDPLFNEAHAGLGLPVDSYAGLKLHYLNLARASEFAAMELVHRTLRARTPEPLAAGAHTDARRILAMGHGPGPRMTAANALQVVGDTALSAWLPAQERVARFMGEVRVHRNGEPLISEAQIVELQRHVRPGDILLQRREWYLTNAGIPGFWTHAALYVGSAEERGRFFDDPDVRRWTRGLGHEDFESLLGARAPEALRRSRVPDAGHPPRVLEAIAPGVTFTSLEHSGAADSIAVLRPRLSKRERAIALLRAFGYAGRPYDYDFDFATDAALVCSELVYKSYQPGTGTRGLELPLASVAGRLMMTPNEMARMYDATRGAATRPLDFVWMLDGNERTRSAHETSAEVFAGSWRRPKWHVVIAPPPVPADR